MTADERNRLIAEKIGERGYSCGFDDPYDEGCPSDDCNCRKCQYEVPSDFATLGAFMVAWKWFYGTLPSSYDRMGATPTPVRAHQRITTWFWHGELTDHLPEARDLIADAIAERKEQTDED